MDLRPVVAGGVDRGAGEAPQPGRAVRQPLEQRRGGIAEPDLQLPVVLVAADALNLGDVPAQMGARPSRPAGTSEDYEHESGREVRGTSYHRPAMSCASSMSPIW